MLNEGYIVLNGLQNGDEIVTNGTFTVDAAAQLKGKKSMMNEEAGEVKISHTNHN
jgi:Cu(I)/Ag(I) efflux system membrane fusion protein